ncbi:MAG: glycoside hydrolase family 88 protein, partial [Paraglaciecola sp.]|nr:glycoside hydrolase family 88 protein [Paraglaciecola sp.]
MFKTCKKVGVISVAISLLLTACSKDEGQVSQLKQQPATANVSSTKEIQKSAYDIATRAATWQIEQFGHLDYIPESHRAKSEDPKFWIQAAFYIGLTKWLDVDNNPQLMSYVEKVAKEQNYELLTDRPYHADDHTIGQTYIWVAEKTGKAEAYKPTQNHFDWILANQPEVGLEMVDSTAQGTGTVHHEGNCQLRWCWA